MNKKYIVRLSDDERGVCQDIVKRLKGTSEKVNRAQILLKADADGPRWPDAKIAEAYGCSVRTVENLRERLVTTGFDAGLERKKRATPPTPRKLDGVGEAKLIAMRLGKPPAGYGRWSLQLLADELAVLEVVPSICAETVRKTLKKTTARQAARNCQVFGITSCAGCSTSRISSGHGGRHDAIPMAQGYGFCAVGTRRP
jgi:Homeodomain-like domain